MPATLEELVEQAQGQSDDTDPTTSSAAPADSPALTFDALKEATGRDYSEKYESPAEALKGLASLESKIGQREEGAKNWDALSEALAEVDGGADALKAILSGELPSRPEQKAEPAPAAGGQELKSLADFRLLEQQIYSADGKVRPGVSDATKQRFTDAARRMEEAQFQLAYKPEELFEGVRESLRKELLEETQQSSAEQITAHRDAAEMESLVSKHSDLLFVGDDRNQLTQIGQKVHDTLNEFTEAGTPMSPRAVQLAIKTVLAQQPKAKPTRPATDRTTRKPGIQVNEKQTEEELAERFRKGADLVDVLMEQQAELEE